MSHKHARTRSSAKVTIVRSDDDLELDIKRGARRQRVFSIIVLALLLLAFVATSAIQALPLLFNSSRSAGAGAGPAASQPVGSQ